MLRILFMLYIFFMPMGSFFNIPSTGTATAIKFMGLNMALIGIIIIFIHERRVKLTPILNAFLFQYYFMVAYSVLAAIILTFVLETQFEPPLSCITGDIVLYFEQMLAVYFVYYCLNYVCSYQDIYKALNWQIIVSLLFGILQILAVLGFGPAASIYEILSLVIKLVPIEQLVTSERGITLLGPEVSTLTLYCFITIPYILYRIFYSSAHRLLFIVAFLAFVFLFIATLSTQNMIVLISVIISFVLLSFSKKFFKPLLFCAFIAGFTLVMITRIDDIEIENNNMDHNSLEYVIMGKAVDKDNMSTQMRASTIINDIKIFESNVVYGVGDGCQGYWYKDNIPDWCKESPEVMNIINNNGVPNGGGAFFPCYLSAYGIIGVVMLLIFIGRYRKFLKYSMVYEDNQTEMIHMISMIVIMFSCWYTVNFRETPFAWLTLALPLCDKRIVK